MDKGACSPAARPNIDTGYSWHPARELMQQHMLQADLLHPLCSMVGDRKRSSLAESDVVSALVVLHKTYPAQARQC